MMLLGYLRLYRCPAPGVGAVVAFVVTLAGASPGFCSNDSTCADKMATRGSTVPKGRDACELLAIELVARALDAPSHATPQAEDVAPEREPVSGTAGSPAQIDPVADVRPVSLAGGAISLVAAKAGTRAITAVNINPLGLQSGERGDGERFAGESRLFDLTLLLPFDLQKPLSQQDSSSLDFAGIRARVDLTALSKGDEVLEAVKAAYDKAAVDTGLVTEALRELLRTAEKASLAGACFDAVSAQRDKSAIEKACASQPPDLNLYDTKTEIELREAFKKARNKADDYYFGLDLRADIGRGLGTTTSTGTKGSVLSAALAYGVRFDPADFKVRAGIHYWRPSDGDGVFSVEGGASFGWSSNTPSGRVSVSFGAETRYTKSSKPLEENFLDFRVGVEVPLTSGGALGVGVAVPVWSDTASPRLVVSGDFGLLK
jgi:hypothetical protein